MLKDVLARVEQRLIAVKLKATTASREAGLSEDAIRNMRRAVEEDPDRGVSMRTIQALAPILKTTVGWLLDGTGEESPLADLCPIIGKVDANANGLVIRSTAQAAGDMAPRPPGGTSKSVALEVEGHSMRGWADDGALIYFEEQHTTPSRDMLGEVVVVELDTGEVLVKRLLRGSDVGLYDLESINGATLRDRRVAWAAHVTAIIPPHKARQIIVKAHEANAA